MENIVGRDLCARPHCVVLHRLAVTDHAVVYHVVLESSREDR